MRKAIFILGVLFMLFSCRKNAQPGSVDYLGVWYDQNLRIHEAFYIRDSTALRDSLEWAQPPTNHIYKWTVTPSDPALYLSPTMVNGEGYMTFGHSGIYAISASFFDSLTGKLLGHTDVVSVTVGTDTLFPYQFMNPTDTLLISPSVGYGLTLGSLDTLYDIQLISTSVKTYLGGGSSIFVYSTSTGTNSYTFSFSDSVYLGSFPFAYSYDVPAPLSADLILTPLTLGVPVQLSITWLGKTYSGSVTQTGPITYQTQWDNSGAVKFVSP
jgi:hypothetical protein